MDLKNRSKSELMQEMNEALYDADSIKSQLRRAKGEYDAGGRRNDVWWRKAQDALRKKIDKVRKIQAELANRKDELSVKFRKVAKRVLDSDTYDRILELARKEVESGIDSDTE
jgi:hypothetical protein